MALKCFILLSVLVLIAITSEVLARNLDETSEDASTEVNGVGGGRGYPGGGGGYPGGGGGYPGGGGGYPGGGGGYPGGGGGYPGGGGGYPGGGGGYPGGGGGHPGGGGGGGYPGGGGGNCRFGCCGRRNGFYCSRCCGLNEVANAQVEAEPHN